MPARLNTIAETTVVTSGTKVRLLASISNAVKIWISAPSANTGPVVVGDVNVSSTRGIFVFPGTTQTIYAQDDLVGLDEMWVDGPTGAKIYVSYLQRL